MPAAGAHVGGDGVNVTESVQQQSHGVGGYLVGTVVGHVGNADTGRCRRVQIDVVHAYGRFDDGQATGQMRQYPRSDRNIANDESHRILTGRDQLIFVSAWMLHEFNV